MGARRGEQTQGREPIGEEKRKEIKLKGKKVRKKKDKYDRMIEDSDIRRREKEEDVCRIGHKSRDIIKNM